MGASTRAIASALPAMSARSDGARSGAAPALIAITLDLEMARNFPTWEQTEWDYQKGNLDSATKSYALAAARRVKARGGRIHFFVVGQVLEQPNIDWLKRIAEDGHPLGNHTYDHVNVRATRLEDVQFRFQRAPWLVAGKHPRDVIRENIRLCAAAMKDRLGVEPVGFRTPGGFHDGLETCPQARAILRDLGYSWVSSKYPSHPMTRPRENPTTTQINQIAERQAAAKPFRYPDGLIEVPMNPVSDVNAFRTGQWTLDAFLETLRASVNWVIERGATFDFLGHPSVLSTVDPGFRTIDLLCELVRASHEKARLADLREMASRAS